MPDVTDDEGGEDEEQRDHWEGRGRPHHFCRSERQKSGIGQQVVYSRKQQAEEYSSWNFSVRVKMLLTENVGCVFCGDFYFWLSEIL